MASGETEKDLLEAVKNLLDLSARGIYGFNGNHKKHKEDSHTSAARAADLYDAFEMAVVDSPFYDSLKAAFRKTNSAWQIGDPDFIIMLNKELKSMGVPEAEREGAVRAYEYICDRISGKKPGVVDAGWNPLLDQIIDATHNADDRTPSREKPTQGIGPAPIRKTPRVKPHGSSVTKYTASEPPTNEDIIKEAGGRNLPFEDDEDSSGGEDTCHYPVTTENGKKVCGAKFDYESSTFKVCPITKKNEPTAFDLPMGKKPKSSTAGCGMRWIPGTTNDKGVRTGNNCPRCGRKGIDSSGGPVRHCTNGHYSKIRVEDNECSICGFQAVYMIPRKHKSGTSRKTGLPISKIIPVYKCPNGHEWEAIKPPAAPPPELPPGKRQIPDEAQFLVDRLDVGPEDPNDPLSDIRKSLDMPRPTTKGAHCKVDHPRDQIDISGKCDCDYQWVTIGESNPGIEEQLKKAENNYRKINKEVANSSKGNERRTAALQKLQEIRKKALCPKCKGAGILETKDCEACGGSGINNTPIKALVRMAPGPNAHYFSKWRGSHIYKIDDMEFIGEEKAIIYLTQCKGESQSEAAIYLNSLRTKSSMAPAITGKEEPARGIPGATPKKDPDVLSEPAEGFWLSRQIFEPIFMLGRFQSRGFKDTISQLTRQMGDQQKAVEYLRSLKPSQEHAVFAPDEITINYIRPVMHWLKLDEQQAKAWLAGKLS